MPFSWQRCGMTGAIDSHQPGVGGARTRRRQVGQGAVVPTARTGSHHRPVSSPHPGSRSPEHHSRDETTGSKATTFSAPASA